jgi:predicted DNA-binding protein
MTTATAPLEAAAVGKDRKKGEDKQVTFRLSAELHARVEAAARRLELDVSSLLRVMIRKQLPHIEREAEELRQLEEGGKEGD